MKKCLIFLFFFILNQVSAQILISGKVIDLNTKNVLSGVTVYINNTSIGLVTDSVGSFKFYTTKFYTTKGGKIELVFSHLSFQKKIVVIDEGKSENLKVELLAGTNTLNEIVITGRKTNKATIRNWVDLFSQNLIGSYPNVSLKCKIKNPEVLYFDYNKSIGELQVFARAPVLIENLALGYTIRLDLDEFVYSFKTNDVNYKYSVFFEELIQPRSKVTAIDNNRRGIYYGSTMHFMRSLHQDSLERNGFSIFKFTSIANKERQRVIKIIQDKIEYAYANQVNPRIEMSSFFYNIDTINYYREILNQKSYLSFDTLRLKTNQVRKLNNETILANFFSEDTLMVVYKGPDPEKINKSVFSDEFIRLDRNGMLFNTHEKRTTHFLNWNSYMVFLKKEGVNIQNSGYYSEKGIFIYGDMGERRLAGMLPFDYYPKTSL